MVHPFASAMPLKSKGDTHLREEVEALGLDLGDQVGVRPGDVRQRPVRARPRPHAAALEGRGDLRERSLH